MESEAPSSSEVRIRPPRAAAAPEATYAAHGQARRRDAERARRRAVGADGRQMPARRHLVPDVGADQERPEEDHRRDRDREPFAVAELAEPVPEAEARHVVRDRLGEAARRGEAAERHDDRREAEVGDQHAVHQAPGRSDQDCADHGDQDRLVVHLGERAEDSHPQDADRADREVDVARQNEHRARHRDQPDDRDLQQDDVEVRVREEVARARREERAQQDQSDQQPAALISPQPGGELPPGEGGTGRRRLAASLSSCFRHAFAYFAISAFAAAGFDCEINAYG